MKTPSSYSLGGYGEMIAPTARMHGYLRALRSAIRPGDVVVDIGAGTGIFSLLACQFGAGHVHAIEPDDSILLGPSLAAANGFAGRITFHQRLSHQVSLPRGADIVVSDLRGILPLFQHHIPAIVDARQRLLAAGGVLIPEKDVLHAAVVESPAVYERYKTPWLQNEFGVDLSAAHSLVVNQWRKARIEAAQLLTASQIWAVLDYRTIESPNVSRELAWTAQRDGAAHGLGVWFDAELGSGIGFSNAPGQPELVYGQAFFPFERPVELKAGDHVSVILAANLIDAEYVFSWSTLIESGDSQVKARFTQSTFLGEVISPAKQKRMSACYIPSAIEEMEIDKLCLSLADGARSLGDIARALSQVFAHRFQRPQDALAYVAGFLEKYEPAAPADAVDQHHRK
jgi:type I protein arginine methyltransferase